MLLDVSERCSGGCGGVYDSSLPGGFAGLCKARFYTGAGLSWILQSVAATMVSLPVGDKMVRRC